MSSQSYYSYLNSPQWRKAKERSAKKYGWMCSMNKCPRFASEYHHLSYDHLWDEDDWEFIRPVCHKCHYHAHFSLRAGKIPLTYHHLAKRYNYLRKATWRRFRPSWVFDWLIDSYRV